MSCVAPTNTINRRPTGLPTRLNVRRKVQFTTDNEAHVQFSAAAVKSPGHTRPLCLICPSQGVLDMP